ncbi:MAG TPA: O-antigen ligase family protein [Bacteroidales bacterium]|nr:O-antigen ligase family protein [Bacteroidales bacterium]HQI69172.1 O-antigen ligase family protein [Bacteroidales bacterium]
MRILRTDIHRYIYILGLTAMAVSLTLSLYVMSVAQFVLLANWLAEGRLVEKFKTFFRHKAALVFTSIYLLHLAGLFCTYDFETALVELRIKLPLLALPVILSTSPLISGKTINTILLFHIAGTLVSGLYSFYLFQTSPVQDIRDIFIISHIRYALNICTDIFILLYFIFTKNKFNPGIKILFSLLTAWFIYFLFFMESFTGIILLIITLVAVLIIFVFKHSKPVYKISLLIFSLALVSGSVLYVHSIYEKYINIDPVNPQKLEKFTRHGNPYVHDLKNPMTDNGHYTWIYVCEPELKEAWDKRSKIKYGEKDAADSPVKYTMIRYLTSKGLKKDMDAVNSLSDEEIALIEKGVANIDYVKKGSFRNRLKNVLWEYEIYKFTGDPRGQTFMQRVELWKTSVRLIKDHFWLGLGTGDVKNVVAAKLEIDDSLLKNSKLRPHNQYLTLLLEFGIFGFLFFAFCLFYPPLRQKKMRDFLYLTFFIIVVLSMFTEDTFETQAGVTYFAFFSCLFLFVQKNAVSENKTLILE